jgi:hypothetical protein
MHPMFREYNLAVLKWLRNLIKLPRFERYTFDIEEITLNGTEGGGVNQHEIHLSSDQHIFKPGHTIEIQGSERNDNYFVVQEVSGSVLILDKDYKRLRSDQPRPGGIVKMTVNVIYGEMQRSIAWIAQPLRNGSIRSPGVAFYITDFQPKIERTRPVENTYTKTIYDENGQKIKSVRVPPLQEYRINYSINVWSVYQQELAILQYQIASEFDPEKFFWIGENEYGFDYEQCRLDRQGHGQWAHSLMEAIADVSDLEPGDANERTLRTEISFAITNAYIPLPYDTNQPIIEQIDLENRIEERLSRI